MKLSVPNRMSTKPAVQILETFYDEVEAERFYNNVSYQEGVTHVRLLQPSASKPSYRVQALMVGQDLPADAVPDGMRRVSVTDSMLSVYDAVDR